MRSMNSWLGSLNRKVPVDIWDSAPRGVVESGMAPGVATVLVDSTRKSSDTQRISVVWLTHYERLHPSDKAWAVLVLCVLAYEVLAKDGEMLSHAYDRWIQRRPVITWAATLVTAAHLLNLLPLRIDPFVLRGRRG